MAEKASTKVTLIVSPDKEPTIAVKAGSRVELIELDAIYVDQNAPQIVLGTLCGYSDTYCIALVEAAE